MIKGVYRCNSCKKTFKEPLVYEEEHGMDAPPYERVAVCPICQSADFFAFDTVVEKIEVAEKVLPAIAVFNRHFNNVKDIFGIKSENSDFSDGVGMLQELISELFSFIPVEVEREILQMNTEKECERIFTYLKG